MAFHTRCKDYDDDGKAIGKGCPRGSRCVFIHPNDPRWSSAARRNSSRQPFRKGSWGAPPASPSQKTVDPSWDSSVWTAGSVSSTSDNERQNPSSISSRYHSGWGASATEDGNTSRDLGRGVPPVGDWSTISQTSSAEGGGDNSSEWGTGWNSIPDTDAGWGDGGGEDSGWGDSSSSFDGAVINQQISSSSTGIIPADSFLETSRQPGNTRKSKLLNKQDDQGFNISNSRTTFGNFPRPTSPITTSPIPMPSPRVAPPSQSTEFITPSSIGNLKRKFGDLSERSSDNRAEKTPTGLKGRVALYQQIVKNIQSVVIFQVLSDKAFFNEERWKKTQLSVIYSNSSPATISKLDTQRKDYRARFHVLKDRRDHALQNLIELPDFGLRTPRPYDLQLDKTKIANYTLELRDWFRDLDLHRRIIQAQDSKQEIESSEMAEQPSITTLKNVRQVEEFRKQRDWTWDGIKEILADLELNAQSVAGDQIYPSIFTNHELEDTAELILNRAKAKRKAAVRRRHLETVANLKGFSEAAGIHLGHEAVKTADLITAIHNAQRELDYLKTETRKLNALKAEAESQLEQFEQWQRTDEQRIHDITQRLRVLHTHRRSSGVPHSQRPVTINDIAPELRQKILGQLQSDIKPILQSLIDGCKENSDTMKAEMEQLVSPLVEKTKEICERARALSTIQSTSS